MPREAAAATASSAKLLFTIAYTASIDDQRHRDGAAHVEPPGLCGRAIRESRVKQNAHTSAPIGRLTRNTQCQLERARQQAAGEHADAAAAGADEAVDAHRLGAVGRLAEQIHDERERDRRNRRAAQSLHDPRPDEQPLRVASAQTSDAAVKSAVPSRNSRRWP